MVHGSHRPKRLIHPAPCRTWFRNSVARRSIATSSRRTRASCLGLKGLVSNRWHVVNSGRGIICFFLMDWKTWFHVFSRLQSDQVYSDEDSKSKILEFGFCFSPNSGEEFPEKHSILIGKRMASCNVFLKSTPACVMRVCVCV